MYCKYCGNKIPSESVFCPFCGKRLSKDMNPNANIHRKARNVDANYLERTSESNTPDAENENLKFNKTVAKETVVGSSIWGSLTKGLKIVWKGIVAIIIVLAFLREMDPYNNIINITDMREAYSCAQEIISDNIMVKEYEFPEFEPEFVTQRTKTIEYEGIEYRVHTVSSYVYAENIFGVMMRTDYVVEIGFPTDSDVDGYYYEIISIE